MRHFPIRAYTLKASHVVAAFSFLLFAVASQANAEPPRSPEEARQMYELGWQARQEQFQRQRRPPRAVKRIRRSETPAEVDNAEEEPVEKSADARVVLVVGDFMASGLADALTGDYAQSPRVKVVDATNGSSGLVRNDFYDWSKEIGPIMDSAKPSVVVVMLGANDRQAMTVGTTKEPPRSDAWTAEYVRRAEALTKAVRDRKIPLVWVGQPAFKYASMSSDMLALDDIYQRVTEAAGGEYVDIWDGFVDENGAFRFTGPDVNGQPVRLRSDDGITLSKAGKLKVAFYAEKPLNKILGSAATSGTGVQPNAQPGAGPAGTPAPSLDRTAPISLSGPPADGNADLLGSKAVAKPGIARTTAERLTIEGVAPYSPPGRADDFGGANKAPAALPLISQVPVPPADSALPDEKSLNTTGAVKR
ncbi:MAG: SGNH/GDSL hydrolase family protein [Rhizobiaceae bacterium]